MEITLKREATCAECGATLPPGTRARWYRNGAVYGLSCHEQAPRGARRGRRGRSSARDNSPGAIASRLDPTGLYTPDGECIGRASCGHIDYPCCGCGS